MHVFLELILQTLRVRRQLIPGGIPYVISCCDGIGHYPGLLTEVSSFMARRQKALIAGSL